MPPTSIDGTDITGATIDGTDVQEITVDGQTVFTAGPQINLPVGYSNLVAWYPFDSATYGGANADDVTAIIGGSGDDTAYNLSSDGSAIYNSSGGATDINAGSSSGYYRTNNPGTNGFANTSISKNITDFTICYWVEQRSTIDNATHVAFSNNPDTYFLRQSGGGGLECGFPGNSFFTVNFGITTGQFYHVAFRNSNGNSELFINGQSEQTGTMDTSGNWDVVNIGNRGQFDNPADVDIDDVRAYTTSLTNSEINQIYQNTQP